MIINLEPADANRLTKLIGISHQNIKQIERSLGIEISSRGNEFALSGPEDKTKIAATVLQRLYQETAKTEIEPNFVHLLLQEHSQDQDEESDYPEIAIRSRKRTIKPRTKNQHAYMFNILRHDVNFGIGPAGTGKTYLAVACAVEALNQQQVQRLVLVRPAVEAGEKLGFLPGDLVDKVDPYLRPLYDALYEMIGFDKVAKLIEKNVIEIAPLAFMRGRTLNDAFVILDEAQNTTSEQMKMFLTRLGFGSNAVITGDVTQIDLPGHVVSGLKQAIEVLKDIEGIHFTMFQRHDVVRHQLVKKIVKAYEDYG